MEITLTINREKIINRVGTIAEYTGAKSEDEVRYDRERTIDEDRNELIEMWAECRADVIRALSHALVSEGMGEGTESNIYHVTLEVWDDFKTVQLPMITRDLESYFEKGILAKWYQYSNEEESGNYAIGAASHLEALRSATIKKMLERGIKPF